MIALAFDILWLEKYPYNLTIYPGQIKRYDEIEPKLMHSYENWFFNIVIIVVGSMIFQIMREKLKLRNKEEKEQYVKAVVLSASMSAYLFIRIIILNG